MANRLEMQRHPSGYTIPWHGIFISCEKDVFMWYNGNCPVSYQHQPLRLRQKALEIANALLATGVDERSAADTGLRQAREFFRSQRETHSRVDPNLPAFP